MGKRVLCIGGGGASGAITVGRLAFRDIDYDVIVGVSTGAMMAPLVALRKWDKLIEAYTTTTNDKVFKSFPFTKSGKLSVIKTLWRAIWGHYSIGDTTPLEDLVKNWFTYEDYKELQNKNIEVIVAVLNVTSGHVEYKSNKDGHGYEVFCRYIAAASSPELIGSVWEFNDMEYSDSGLATLVPIVKASKVADVEEIHVYTHRMFTREPKRRSMLRRFEFLQIIHAAYRFVLIQRDNLEYKELREGVLRCLVKGIKIKVTFIDDKFKQNNMVMNPSIMNEMVEYGKKTANDLNVNYVFDSNNWEGLFDLQDDE